MTDVGTNIREAFFQVLNGHVSIEGAPIPFVDEKLDVDISEQDIYVLFTTQDEDVNKSNKSRFATEVQLSLQIVNQRRATNTKEIVEDVSNQILSILFPTRTSWAISLNSPLSLSYCTLVRAQYNPIVQNEKGFIISKVLTFKNRITQN